jgi:hypothetical protein
MSKERGKEKEDKLLMENSEAFLEHLKKARI